MLQAGTSARRARSLVLLLVVAACGSGDDSPATSDGVAVSFSAVYVDPRDPRHLIVGVAECTDGATVTVDERPGELLVTIEGTVNAPPCTPEQLDVTLRAPFSGKQAVDSVTGRRIDVVEAAWLEPTAPPERVPADCSPDSVREAVTVEIDGGLRRDVRSCDESWLVVRTWTDACPATGEPMEEHCLANDHTAYFANEEGTWRVFAFDDCEVVLRERPAFPRDRCA